MTSSSTITLQRATADDDAALRTLSQLDSARPLQRPALLAVVDGRSVAAASLSDGRVVADPFTDSAEAVALLRSHRSALLRSRGRGRRRTNRIPRLRLRAA
ncbi:hypothetical protein [Baekduia sp.]|uniref:hypothetical protein n=1 Tax=Baekduia sp. TaxID=2600305 RepID=UPI0032C216B6